MLKLAQELKKTNIKFRWTIFTDLKLYNQKPFNLEEIIYMQPSYDFMDYIVEADYGVQLSDTEGYSYFVNECLQYGTPVICTNFESVYESVQDGVNGYILDMDLSNLDVDKILNKIPKNFEYKEKTTIEDWQKILNKRRERRTNMYKIVAVKNYTDTRPELITEFNGEIKYNDKGNAEIKERDVYFVADKQRAEVIKKSGLAKVEEIKEVETAVKKVKAETAVKRTRKKKE